MTSLRKITLKSGVTVKKKPLLFRPKILSRHPSHDILRSKHKHIPLSRYKSVIRFGSTTELPDTIDKGGNRIEINTIDAIKNSSNKLLMKQKFIEAGVKTAIWFTGRNIEEIVNTAASQSYTNGWEFKLVAKAHFGSKGTGNSLISSEDELVTWSQGKNLSHYIFEKYMNYGHEFRLHISEDGCFYACRKALKSNVPEEEKWHRHDTTCVWFLETNENFHKPNSWNDIVEDCIKALKAISADILSFDVRVQTPTSNGIRRDYQDYVLIECNSASSMDNGTGEISICAQKYIEEIPKIILKKSIR